MRIVRRDEFLSMPMGTVYSTYEPCIFGPLCIKGHSLENDFYYQPIADAVAAESSDQFADRLLDAERDGHSVPVDLWCEGRDGMFDEGQLFAAWEPQDVFMLIRRLQQAMIESSSPQGVS